MKQVVAKMELGMAAGIAYVPDALAAPRLTTMKTPREWNVAAQHVVAPMTSARDGTLAGAFVNYTRSPATRTVPAKWGFGPAE